MRTTKPLFGPIRASGRDRERLQIGVAAGARFQSGAFELIGDVGGGPFEPYRARRPAFEFR